MGVSTEIPCIFPDIREFGRRDALAAASQHSHLVAVFRLSFKAHETLPKKPRIAPLIGDDSAEREQRDTNLGV